MSKMNQNDWDQLNREWSTAMYSQEMTPDEPTTPFDTADLYHFLYVAKETQRATFFVIEEIRGRVLGFWLPNSAIVRQKESEVLCANWCEIKIIEFR